MKCTLMLAVVLNFWDFARLITVYDLCSGYTEVDRCRCRHQSFRSDSLFTIRWEIHCWSETACNIGMSTRQNTHAERGLRYC